MRWITTGLLALLLCSICDAQTVKLGALDSNGQPVWKAKWVTVPAPQAPITGGAIGYSPNQIVWGNTAMTGGTFEVRNALVDKRHLVGAWSQPAIVTPGNGWQLYGGSWNQLPSFDSVGVVWKVKCISLNAPSAPAGWDFTPGQEYLYADNSYGVGPVQIKGPIPWSPSVPNLQYIGFIDQYWPLSRIRFGGSNTTVAPPPPVTVINVPVQVASLRYCYVTHTGETALSPPAFTSVPAGILPNTIGLLNCVLGEAIPMGALGYHLYLDDKRVPAPHCLGTPQNENDWLWPVNQYQVTVTHVVPNAPSPSPAAQAKSYLNKLQVAMKETTGNIDVDETYLELYCPIIDEWSMAGGWPLKFGRKIEQEDGEEIAISQMKSFTVDGQTYTYPTYWPGLVVHNQLSKWYGVMLNMKYGSCALTYADYSGGQAFTNEFHSCSFGCSGLDPATDQPAVPRVMTYGMRISTMFTKAGHSASEQIYENCGFSGTIAAAVEDNQAANLWFNRGWFISYDPAGCLPDRRAFSLWLSAPVPIRFNNGIFAECPTNVIWGLGWSPQVTVGDTWTDGGCVSLVDFTHYQPGSIQFTGGKVNLWSPPGVRPNLARVYNTTLVASMQFDGTSCQLSSGSEADVCSVASNRFVLFYSNSNILGITVLREPTAAQMMTAYAQYVPPFNYTKPAATAPAATIKAWNDWIAFVNPPYAGRSITIPALSTTVPGNTLVINGKVYTINDKLVTTGVTNFPFYSFDRPGTIKRRGWWDALAPAASPPSAATKPVPVDAP